MPVPQVNVIINATPKKKMIIDFLAAAKDGKDTRRWTQLWLKPIWTIQIQKMQLDVFQKVVLDDESKVKLFDFEKTSLIILVNRNNVIGCHTLAQ